MTALPTPGPANPEPAREPKPVIDPLQRSRTHLATARQALDERRQVAGPIAPVQQAASAEQAASAAPDTDPLDWLSPESATRIGLALSALLAAAALGYGTRTALPHETREAVLA